MTWIYATTRHEIPARGARVLELDGVAVALFKTSDGRVFALRDECPHRRGPLSQGIVHGACVTCPLHDWVINLETGEARAPDEGKTEIYAVRVHGDSVFIEVPEAGAGTLFANQRAADLA